MRKLVTYPVMVCKNGNKNDYQICNKAEELVVAAQDDYYPLFMESKEDVLNNPAINRELQAVINTEEDKKKKDEVVKNVVNKNKLRRNNVK